MKTKDITREEAEGLGSTVNHEVVLLCIMAIACDAMVFDIERRMKAIDRTLQLKREAKMRMSQYLKLLASAESQFENFIAPTILKVGEGNDFSDYETLRVYAQEIIRLLMSYYEKCDAHEKHTAVFDLIASFDGGKGVFSAEDINRFDLGCRKHD